LFPWFKRLFQSRPAPLAIVEADDTGFSLTREGHRTVFPWECVTRIAACKEDLHTHDRIVLLVEVRKASTELLSIPADYPGFAELFGPMERALGLNPSWYLEIMTPAFDPTPTVLYLRSMDDDN
jgi:hypothetical protein